MVHLSIAVAKFLQGLFWGMAGAAVVPFVAGLILLSAMGGLWTVVARRRRR
jgi:predicted cobalt transporter CbtA